VPAKALTDQSASISRTTIAKLARTLFVRATAASIAARDTTRGSRNRHGRKDRPAMGPTAAGTRPHAGGFRERISFADCTTSGSHERARRWLGAAVFDSIRYVSTVIGEWARDKLTRYALLTATATRIWDFGSAAKHRLHAPWLAHDPARGAALRGATGGDITLFRDAAREIKSRSMPKVSTATGPRRRRAADAVRQKLGVVRDGQQTLLHAREERDGTLLNMAAAMVDGVGHRGSAKPGVKSEIVALATSRLYLMDPACVRRSTRSQASAAHLSANFTDRDPSGRPGVLRHHPVVHGYRTCRTGPSTSDATPAQHRVSQGARMDGSHDRPAEARRNDGSNRTLAQPQAGDSGFARARWTRSPQRLPRARPRPARASPRSRDPNSLKGPSNCKAGMVFAVATCCPATDSISAARIDGEVILTPSGPPRSIHPRSIPPGTADRQPTPGGLGG
jgi:Xaa-Pro dipeptidase